MGVLEKVVFNPSQSITFAPDNTKQMVELVMENASDVAVMYKMKSTRPGLYKMRPVYDVILPGDKKSTKLIYKGLKAGQKTPINDRFTVVLATAPSTTTRVDKVWKTHKYHTKMADAELRKKHIQILYAGVNDLKPLPVGGDEGDDDDRFSKHKSVVRKGKGLVDEDDAVPASSMQPTQKNVQEKGPMVLLMYRPVKAVFDEDSDTDEEDDEDEEKEEKQPQSSQPQQKESQPTVQPEPKQSQPAVARISASKTNPRKAPSEKKKSAISAKTAPLAKLAPPRKVPSKANQKGKK